MKLILSRKGFDSGAGGCPSPIFPDGTLVSLPIPDKRSPVRYCDLTWRGRNLGDVVETLTRGRQRRDFRAHLDPDLRSADLRRPPGWRPVLGQTGSAQGHLRRQSVGPGDLFLFFGLFRPVDADVRWAGSPEHRIWGWLQVGEVVAVDDIRDNPTWAWARGHPHFAMQPDPRNTLYVAADRLSLVRGVDGAGVIEVAGARRRLTAEGASVSTWRLPIGFLPKGRPPLTFHRVEDRWRRDGADVLLRAVSKGQEFILDLDLYPDVRSWVRSLLSSKPDRGSKGRAPIARIEPTRDRSRAPRDPAAHGLRREDPRQR